MINLLNLPLIICHFALIFPLPTLHLQDQSSINILSNSENFIISIFIHFNSFKHLIFIIIKGYFIGTTNSLNLFFLIVLFIKRQSNSIKNLSFQFILITSADYYFIHYF